MTEWLWIANCNLNPSNPQGERGLEIGVDSSGNVIATGDGQGFDCSRYEPKRPIKGKENRIKLNGTTKQNPHCPVAKLCKHGC